MIAVDTNVLVYVHMVRFPQHERALAALRSLAGSGRAWGVPWACVHEFVAAVTNPRAFDDALRPGDALDAIEALRDSSNLTFLHEGPGHVQVLRQLLAASGARGGAVHDARIAAVCIANKVDELWTVDRDFLRFPGIRVRNPLLGSMEPT